MFRLFLGSMSVVKKYRSTSLCACLYAHQVHLDIFVNTLTWCTCSALALWYKVRTYIIFGHFSECGQSHSLFSSPLNTGLSHHDAVWESGGEFFSEEAHFCLGRQTMNMAAQISCKEQKMLKIAQPF